MDVNKENLENSLGSGKKSKQPEAPKMSKEMEIGFHQGALNTLVNERNEIIKMVQAVESIMQAHMKRLEELGVKLQKKAE